MDFTLIGLSKAYKKKAISPVEIANIIITNLKNNDTLNAINYFDEEILINNALASQKRYVNNKALSAIDGIPIGIKDIIDTQGLPTSYGCGAYKEHQPLKDAFVVQTLKEHGASIAVKCNTAQFAIGLTGEYSLNGAVKNPSNHEYVTGGSSSGSSAAVAAKILPAAIGTETGGSIRIPASLCGIVGMKPTYSLISCEGMMPHSEAVDTIGPLTTNVRDNAFLLQHLIRHNDKDWRHSFNQKSNYFNDIQETPNDIKIIAINNFFEQSLPYINKNCKEAIQSLSKFGATIVEKNLPNLQNYGKAHTTVMLAPAYSIHKNDLNLNREYLYPEIIRRLEGGDISADEYFVAERKKNVLRSLLLDWMGDCSCLAYPTAPIPACKISEGSKPIELAGKSTTSFAALGATVFLATASGLPCISIPVGRNSDNLPYGIDLLGRPFEEDKLYRIAEKIEQTVCFK